MVDDFDGDATAFRLGKTKNDPLRRVKKVVQPTGVEPVTS
jgi:hypothetical protein